MAPRSLSTWMQHLGQAGWLGSLAVFILLVKPYVFQLKRTKKQNTNKIKHLHNKLVPIKQEDIKGEVNSEYEDLLHDDPMQDKDSPSKNAMQLHDVDL